MSNAERRNGERVWEAMQALWNKGEMLMTVGEVAGEARKTELTVSDDAAEQRSTRGR